MFHWAMRVGNTSSKGGSPGHRVLVWGHMAATMAVIMAALAGPQRMLTVCADDAVGQAENSVAGAATMIGQRLIVTNGAMARANARVSLPFQADDANVHVVALGPGGERPLPAQVDSGTPRRLWWVIPGPLAGGESREFRLAAGAPPASSHLRITADEKAYTVQWQGRPQMPPMPVLQYNHAHVLPPQGLDPRFGRSAYIHPVWTPGGTVVTDEFPPDHAHQSGIFLAYTKTRFENREPNFWELAHGRGRVRFVRRQAAAVSAGPIFVELVVDQEHVDETAPGGKVALRETWRLQVWNVGSADGTPWVVDLESTRACASSEPLYLPQYHYGGMALRGARSWGGDAARFLTSDGADRLAGNHTRPRWCDLSGTVAGRQAGLALLTHPGNFRYPEPLRIHPTMPYLVYTPSHLGDWAIEPGTPQTSRYRLLVHDGPLTAATADQWWLDFAEPLVAQVRP
ncbi:MAG: PmoA family protein [Pirellulales bacterium]